MMSNMRRDVVSDGSSWMPPKSGRKNRLMTAAPRLLEGHCHSATRGRRRVGCANAATQCASCRVGCQSVRAMSTRMCVEPETGHQRRTNDCGTSPEPRGRRRAHRERLDRLVDAVRDTTSAESETHGRDGNPQQRRCAHAHQRRLVPRALRPRTIWRAGVWQLRDPRRRHQLRPHRHALAASS